MLEKFSIFRLILYRLQYFRQLSLTALKRIVDALEIPARRQLALVVNAKLEDEARAEVVEKAKGYITRYNGNITEVEEWGKKRLAYEIQKMREGYYYFIQFEADATAPAEIERHVRIMDNVLRYLVVKKEA